MKSHLGPRVWPPLFLAVALFSGCATAPPSKPEDAVDYITSRDFVSFYLLGPVQGRPDASVPMNTRLKLLRKEMGYSYVQLPDGRDGYIANEDIRVAPPLPPPAKFNDEEYPPSTSGKKKKRGERYNGPDVAVPLPEPQGPPPDLNIQPEVIPEGSPTPPKEKPSFRY